MRHLLNTTDTGLAGMIDYSAFDAVVRSCMMHESAYFVGYFSGQIAKDTHGFVGADLSQLCMEAALRCIREQMHTIDVDADKIPVVRAR